MISPLPGATPTKPGSGTSTGAGGAAEGSRLLLPTAPLVHTLACSPPDPLPSQPAAATLPLFGVEAALLNQQGQEIEGVGEGCAALGCLLLQLLARAAAAPF